MVCGSTLRNPCALIRVMATGKKQISQHDRKTGHLDFTFSPNSQNRYSYHLQTMPRNYIFKAGTEPRGWAPSGKKRLGSIMAANPKRKKRSMRPAPKTIWEKRDGSIASAEAGREWSNQFYQGKSIMDLSGVGCGFYTLGSPWVPSQYPSPNETRLELMTGTDGDRGGSINLYGPRDYWDIKLCSDACFIVPAAHIGTLPASLLLPRRVPNACPRIRSNCS